VEDGKSLEVSTHRGGDTTMPSDEELYRLLESIWCTGVDAATSTDFREPSGELAEDIYDKYREATLKKALTRIATALHEGEVRGRIEGMEQAKNRVLRRTEIPRDAKNQTHDLVVITGEECARIIEQDIAALKSGKVE